MITDAEFGEVIVRQNALSRGVRFSVSTSGRLQMSVPKGTKEFLLRRFLESNRVAIREKLPLKDPETQRARDAKKKLLTKKAKLYLPYRLDYFAKLYGYHYERVRFSHANTRWGSCSSNGTISLNIGLMQVPTPLQDYVLLHELAHLHHMDHSAAFWA
jgi:predicted metal-dependent hydrolase